MAEQTVDVAEHGSDGQTSDRRLFFQLLVFDIEPSSGPRSMAQAVSRKLQERRIPSVVYEDANDHRGLGILVWNEDPSFFTNRVRPLLGGKRFSALIPRPGWAMFGRTYASGYEADLEHWLLERPRERVLDPELVWSVWYPLRRKSEFGSLDGAARGAMLREHGEIGRAFGEAGVAHDVRLACHGLDPEDNDFVIGLIGKELVGLSKVVEAMRSTRQTAEYMDKMGPFFVGRKMGQYPAEMPKPEPEEVTPEPTEEPAPEEPPAEDSPVDTVSDVEAPTAPDDGDED